MTPRLPLIVFASLLATGCATTVPTLSPEQFSTGQCEVGVYRADSSRFVAITRSVHGFSYSFDDGRIGNVGNPGAPVECGVGGILVDGAAIWPRSAITSTDTRFRSGDVWLAGRLIEPEGANTSTPLVAFAHGSEPTGWIGTARDPYQMVGRGISVFVYDKRGTGLSEGRYSQNFPRLADDLVAASAEAKRLADGRFGRFGLIGLSQGGWIAPLAAEEAEADFISIGYGLVADIREEDADQVQNDLRAAGYDGDVLAIAREITDVTALIATSEYTQGLDELTAIQERYGSEEWFPLIRGGYSGVFLGMSAEELRRNGVPQFNDLDIDWSLDPMTVMRNVDVPQLWVLAGEDLEAPRQLTVERLGTLRDEGKNISVYTFPETDHGMWEFAERPDGTREYLRVTEGYYDLMADWAKGELAGSYGTAFATGD